MTLEHHQFDPNRKSTSTEMKDSENHNGYFDCNICLDFATEPVVTLCGHLYCWPCIFKWFHVHSTSEYPQCPVCKAEISHTTLIPLYGRGQPESKPDPDPKTSSRGTTHIPPRPAARGTRALLNGTAASQPSQQLGPSRNPYQHQYVNPFGGSEEAVSTPLVQPVVGMFGEMVYARVFGNAHSLYTYPNSYHVVGGYGSRLRRQEMQVDKSLSRISLFLLCCFLLCVLLF